jgi:hypothetical protein
MAAQQYQLGAFPKGLNGSRHVCRINGTVQVTHLQEVRREGLQGLKPLLVKPLLFEDHPVVIPTGQQVSLAQNLRRFLRDLGPAMGDVRHQPARLLKVDGDGWIEEQGILGKAQQARELVGDPEDTGTEAAGGLGF